MNSEPPDLSRPAKDCLEALTLIALSHGVFCWILVYLLGSNIDLTQLKSISPFFIFYGILLGIGEMGFSSLLCLIFICILQKLFPKRVPQEAESWNTISKGGWIRHHIHIIRAFSPVIALPIILMQIGSEEIVFRGIIQNYFLSYGNVTAALISLILFVYMQTFLMPSGLSAMFPVVGAFVMGAVHSYLHMKVPFLLPLIIAHMIFFVMSIYIR